MRQFFSRISIGIAVLVSVSSTASAQGSADFCGHTGAMVIGVDPIGRLNTEAMAYAKSDPEAVQRLLDAGVSHPNVAATPDGELYAVLTAMGMAVVVSSPEVAEKFIKEVTCDRVHIVDVK